MLSCFFHFLARSWPLCVVRSHSALSGRGGSRDHSLVLRVCLLPFSLYRGRKKRGPGTRLRTLSRKCIQIRQWGFWKLGNGLFPNWPLPADDVRHLSQSTLNAPLLNEQKPVKHVVAFKAIPTSGHITLWSVVQMWTFPLVVLRELQGRDWSWSIPGHLVSKPVYYVVGPGFT